ncbi:MAG TPA: hypothetical protein VMU05_15045 [Dongiaceae bacterium]|nr:hypothetical protein [Dongiaceae bacterium]
MYSTNAVNGFPAIHRNGRAVLSVWNQDWEFADWLCQLLNGLDDEPALVLNQFDTKWLKSLNEAFSSEAQHV